VTVWVVLAAAIAVEVFATLGLRASEGFRRKAWIAPVVLGYLVSFYGLWLALRMGMPVGIAYGVWTACGVALVAVIARWVFRDPLTFKMIVGIGLIAAGVLTIELAGAVH
jgi:small multidrug resistance pump